MNPGINRRDFLAAAGGAYAATQTSGQNTRQAFLNDVAKRLHVTPQQLTAALNGASIDQLQAEVRSWADEILRLSPTALKVLKQSMNTDTEHFAGIGQMAYSSLKLFGDSAEAKEGITAFNEKRAPDFSAYRSH